ncbi:hypothetical protein INR49_003209 [Caranx melampygus]|nr:hypothetical protein INR49_003209 [Caranx melampygus]
MHHTGVPDDPLVNVSQALSMGPSAVVASSSPSPTQGPVCCELHPRAGSGPRAGSCVKGAVEVSHPVERYSGGRVGATAGGLHLRLGMKSWVTPVKLQDQWCDSSSDCFSFTTSLWMGHYKRPMTAQGAVCASEHQDAREGSERCDCLQGFSRLPTEPDDRGCTSKTLTGFTGNQQSPPSAPVNLTAHHHNDSVLTLTWDPPLDQGGRQEVMYRVKCERQVEAGGPWEACEDGVMVLPSASD